MTALPGNYGKRKKPHIKSPASRWRTVEIDNTPYFVGKDVAEVLGYSNASKAVISHVDDEDKRSIMLDIADSQNGNVPVGQTKTTIINESGQFNVQCAMMMYQTFFFSR